MKTNFVIGDPVTHSLSPFIHNTAYRVLGIENEYKFEPKQVTHQDLARFIKNFKIESNGLAVTTPHKQTIVTLMDEVDEAAREIGAVNTVLNKNGTLIGYNTDWVGAKNALEQFINLKNMKVALLGTGGAARAVAYAINKLDAELTIFGRDDQKIIEISKDFKAMPATINANSEIAKHEVIINATSVGLDESTEVELLPAEMFDATHVVFDIVYGRKTKFLSAAKSAGAKTIDGLEMLIEQAVQQIKILTGHKISSKDLRLALKDKL